MINELLSLGVRRASGGPVLFEGVEAAAEVGIVTALVKNLLVEFDRFAELALPLPMVRLRGHFLPSPAAGVLFFGDDFLQPADIVFQIRLLRLQLF